MNKIELVGLFHIIKQAHQMFSVSEDKLVVWLDLLQDTTFDEAYANLKHHLKTSPRMPVPVDLLQINTSS